MMGGAAAGPGGGGMGGGGRNPKRALTALVGKIELLTKQPLHIQLDAEQSAKIRDKLSELEKAEKLSADDAEAQLTALEGVLNTDQKAIVDSISLPIQRGGGRGGAGGPGAGGPTPLRRPPPGSGPDDNPFRQESDAKRLADLLVRVGSTGATPGATAPTDPASNDKQPEDPASAKPAPASAAPAESEPAPATTPPESKEPRELKESNESKESVEKT